MRKVFADKLRQEFKPKMSKALPYFELVQKKEEYTLSGCPLYRYIAAEDLTFYIYLSFLKYDKFGIEIAWSRDNCFPAFLPVSKDFVPLKGGVRMWDIDLYQYKGRCISIVPRNVWFKPTDTIPEEYFLKIETLIEECMHNILTYDLPYFEQIAEHFGYQVSFPV